MNGFAEPLHRLIGVWVAIAATVLILGLPLIGGIPGRMLGVRVLLVGAVLLCLRATLASASRRAARQCVTAALVLLGFTAALLLRFIAPTGTVLLALAIGGLLWQRRQLATAPPPS